MSSFLPSFPPCVLPSSVHPCRERVPLHMHPEHAAVRRPVAVGDRGDVRRALVLPEGLQRRVPDAPGRLPHVPGLQLSV